MMFTIDGIVGGSKAGEVVRPYHRWLNTQFKKLSQEVYFVDSIVTAHVRYRFDGNIQKNNLPTGIVKSKKIRQSNYLQVQVIFEIDAWEKRKQRDFQIFFADLLLEAYLYILDYARKKNLVLDGKHPEFVICNIFADFKKVDFTGQHLLWPGLPDIV